MVVLEVYLYFIWGQTWGRVNIDCIIYIIFDVKDNKEKEDAVEEEIYKKGDIQKKE